MNPFGIGVLAFIAYIGFRGFQRGLVEEVGRLVGLVLAVFLAGKFSIVLAPMVPIDNETAQRAVAFIGIFLITLFGVNMAAKAIHAVLEFALLGWLDSLGGTLFGVMKSFMILGVVLYIMGSFDTSAAFIRGLEEKSPIFRNVVMVKDGMFKVLHMNELLEIATKQVKKIDADELIRPIIEQNN